MYTRVPMKCHQGTMCFGLLHMQHATHAEHTIFFSCSIWRNNHQTMATWKRQSLLHENIGDLIDDEKSCTGSLQESSFKLVRTDRRFRNTFSLFKACCYAWAVSAIICGIAVHKSEANLSDSGLKEHVSYGAGGTFSMRKAGLTHQRSVRENTIKQCKFDTGCWHEHLSFPYPCDLTPTIRFHIHGSVLLKRCSGHYGDLHCEGYQET